MKLCFRKRESFFHTFLQVVLLLLATTHFFSFAKCGPSREKVDRDNLKLNRQLSIASWETQRSRRQISDVMSELDLSSLFLQQTLNLDKEVNELDESLRLTQCPPQCQCLSGNLKVQCSLRRLNKVPKTLPRNLKSLDLSHNKLTKLSSHAFDRYATTLIEVFLQKNNLISLEGAFTNLTNLEIIRLSWNKVASIRKLTFDDLLSLKKLYLDNNRISFVHPEAFRGLIKLQLLDLSNNRLRQLHPDVFVTTQFAIYFRFLFLICLFCKVTMVYKANETLNS